MSIRKQGEIVASHLGAQIPRIPRDFPKSFCRVTAGIPSKISHSCPVEGMSACTHSFFTYQGKTFAQKTGDAFHGDLHGLHDLGRR